MDNFEPQAEPVTDLDNFFNLAFDGIGCDQLKQCSVWARIVALTSFAGYVVLAYDWLFGRNKAALSGGVGALLSMTIIGGGITANYFLYRFGANIGRGVQNLDALPVNQGLGNLRQYFKTAGILMIVDICIFLFAFALGVLATLHVRI
ncbi:MAG TPA: hypothetical protein VN616_03165 [Puia sp.]|nr:hypothetical protein [Puia sp.]